jgi:hypothetical protein
LQESHAIIQPQFSVCRIRVIAFGRCELRSSNGANLVSSSMLCTWLAKSNNTPMTPEKSYHVQVPSQACSGVPSTVESNLV